MSASEKFLDWIFICNNHNPEEYADFVVENKKVGAIHQKNLPLFQAHPNIFWLDNKQVILNPKFKTLEARTNIVHQLVKNWHVWGRISGWCEQMHTVAVGFNQPPLLTLERSAAPIFGIACYGIHVNGFTYKNNVLHMWVAKRAKNQAIAPKKLDNLAAGSHQAFKQVTETVLQSCHQMANIPMAWALQAQAVGCLHYLLEQRQELCNDTLFIYDLFLPDNFMPLNNDGEVDAFYLWPIERVIETVAHTQLFKTNVNLVLIDFFVRHGYLTPDDENYTTIVKNLHSSDKCDKKTYLKQQL